MVLQPNKFNEVAAMFFFNMCKVSLTLILSVMGFTHLRIRPVLFLTIPLVKFAKIWILYENVAPNKRQSVVSIVTVCKYIKYIVVLKSFAIVQLF